MTEKVENQIIGKLKPLKVMDEYFAYNEVSAAYTEVDSKTWTLICRDRGDASSYGNKLKSMPILKPLLKPHSPFRDGKRTVSLKNIILQVSHSCNLRCRYCSADFGRYGKDFRMMSFDVAKEAVDFLFETSQSKHLSITYFGGEPLLNLDTVLRSARYSLNLAKSTRRPVSLHLVTNGILLDAECLRILDQLGFSLTVSLDGPPEIHDKQRSLPGGKISYRYTARSLRDATCLPIRDRITIRGTFTRNDAYFFPNVRYIIEEGFSRNISYEPVFLPSSHPMALRWKDVPMIKQAYADLANYYVHCLRENKGFCLWDFDDAILQLIRNRPRQARCGSGVSTVSVTAEGDIYGCHMSTGETDTWIGSLETGIINERVHTWKDIYLNGRSGCSDCWLRALCGGGCNTHAIMFNGSFSMPYRLECELIEWRYRLAFWIISQFPQIKSSVLSSKYLKGVRGSDLGHVLVVPIWYCLENY